MPAVIEPVTQRTTALEQFLADHLADMDGTAPPESQHALPFERLLAPGVRLFAMFVDGRPVATGALAYVEEGHEELKSMRTDPALRGRGLGRQMLDFLLTDAAARSIRRVSLETGRDAFFAPARAMYARAGFTACAPFGRYVDDPESCYLSLGGEGLSIGSEGASLRSR